jgi:hypothetical protein
MEMVKGRQVNKDGGYRFILLFGKMICCEQILLGKSRVALDQTESSQA